MTGKQIDMELHDAAMRHVRPKPGMAAFDMVEAFNMLRGHHLDAGVVGGFQVSEKGDFANWALKTPVPHSGISIGGGFDLVDRTEALHRRHHPSRPGRPVEGRP